MLAVAIAGIGLLLPVQSASASLLADAAAAASGCVTSADCSLLGECAAAKGTCVCDVGWTSANCSVLDLAPARWGPARQVSNSMNCIRAIVRINGTLRGLWPRCLSMKLHQ